MLLAIDVGNTNTEFGVFEGENLLGSFRMMTKSNATSDEIGLLVCQYFQRFGLDRTRLEAVMVASVVPQVMYTLTAAMVKYLGLKPIVADVDVDSGLRYGPLVTDERLGPDRSVACVAAMEKYGRPVIVLDFGTATTVDAVGEDGVYQGGCISAGLRVTMDALTANAAMLPNVELNKPEKTLNFTAVGHIQAGVVGGYVGAMEYLIRQAKAEMGREDARVVATGGLARFIAGHTPLIDVVDGELILDGLRMIYERRQT